MKQPLVMLLGASLIFSACKCPQYLPPKIDVNSSSLNVGGKLMLAVPSVKGATPFWAGPAQTTFVGDTWIIDSVSGKMAGTYSVKYVCNHRKKCISSESNVNIEVKECPALPMPVINTDQSTYGWGDSVILSVPSIENTYVTWHGPDTIFKGNVWKRKAFEDKMAGKYTAKYLYDGIKNCESLSATKQIAFNQRTKITFNNKPYYLDVNVRGTVAEVWFRSDIKERLATDLLVLYLHAIEINPDEAAKEFSDIKEEIDGGKAIIGCSAVSGAGLCLLASAAAGGTTAPACEVFIPAADAGVAPCLQALGGIIANKLGQDADWNLATTGASIANQKLLDAIGGEIVLYSIVRQGKVPVVVNNTVQEKPQPVASNPPANGSNNNGQGNNNNSSGNGRSGNGNGGNGHEGNGGNIGNSNGNGGNGNTGNGNGGNGNSGNGNGNGGSGNSGNGNGNGGTGHENDLHVNQPGNGGGGDLLLTIHKKQKKHRHLHKKQ